MTIQSIISDRELCRSFMDRLGALFGQMDIAYDRVAKQYGFHCHGCRDNCCQTLFYHHTLLEFICLADGVRQIDRSRWPALHQQALAVNAKIGEATRQDVWPRVMCPLNKDGLCLIYVQRPMICRLHGIPHELYRPGVGVLKTPGCDEFFNQCRQHGKTDYIPFNRTPFYRDMAILEKELRSRTDYSSKIKLTVAQMLATLTDPNHEIS